MGQSWGNEDKGRVKEKELKKSRWEPSSLTHPADA